MMSKFLLSLILLVSFLDAKSQNIINGKVLDSLTRKPMPYVNVYFVNTTIGTVTDVNGEFSIKGFGSGKYVLAVSFVGYTTAQLPLDFSSSKLSVTINLLEQAIQLKEVYVKADSSDWEENFRIFRDNFLGRTRNASKLVINNPKNLRLFFDKKDSVLVAYAKQPIEIENRVLGYKIFYQLIDFQIDFKKDKMIYRGIPRFEILEPMGPRELNRWEEERKRAYYGSFSHFIQSLKENALEANGFEVYPMKRIPDPNRLTDDQFVEKIIRLRKNLVVVNRSTETAKRQEIIDSLNLLTRKFYAAKFVDSLGARIMDARELFVPGRKDLISYKGMLRVTFKNEREENNYTPGQPPEKQQQSIINFLGKIKLYENGYYEDVSDVFFDEYMGWSEKIAELLPQEYVPEEGKQ